MKLICGPMATISHPAFRFLIEKFGGCSEYYTEMINAPSLINGGQFEKYYINPAPVPKKIVWQLTGKNKESIFEAAKMITELEGIGIDINMGCCAPDIVKSGAGISWMLKPIKETESLIKGTRKILDNYKKAAAIHKRLSVKLRLGDDNFTDKGFFDFCDMLVQNGVEQIALHPRTKSEKYREKAKWQYAEFLAQRYKNTSVKIILNGCIEDTKTACQALQQCPNVSGLMIARAAVEKPWIFELISKGIEKEKTGNKEDVLEIDLYALAEDFLKYLEEYQPPEFWKTRMQRFFSYYAKNLSFAHYAKTLLLKALTPKEAYIKLEEYFLKCPDDRIKYIQL